MKIKKTTDARVVEEITDYVGVVSAGLAGLFEYYDKVSSTGPYMRRAWMMTEAYLSMIADIEARGGKQAYYDAVRTVLERVGADRAERGGTE